MLPSDMPYCLCKINAWQPGGAQMGPGGTFQWFTCDVCKRTALSVYYDGGAVLITDRGRNFSEAELAYVNGPLMTALRARHERLEEARNVVANRYWDQACDAVGVPRGTTYAQIPKAKLEAWRSAYTYDHDPAWLNPAGSGEPFIPPQLPSTLVAFGLQRNRHNRWYRCSFAETKALPVPLDPIRVAHDKYFAEVFEAIRPYAEVSPEHVLNEYCGSQNEPWFRFAVEGAIFTVGPRKRVINISVQFPIIGPEPDLGPIATAGKRDDTTSEWGSRRGSIHAWNKFRLVEYLTILITAAKARVPKAAV